MTFQARQKIPNIAIDARHILCRLHHAFQPRFIHRLHFAEPKTFLCLHDPHRLRMGYLAAGVDDIHAVIEFVTNVGRLIESLDDLGKRFLEILVPDGDLRQALDEIEPARVSC